MEQIGIGIEIECVLNKKIHNIEQGDYHDGYSIPNLNKWLAESDSSLSDYGEFDDWGGCIEIISPIMKGKKAFEEELNNFKEKFSDNGNYELNEVLSFNDSCGSHVHFSINGLSFDKKVIFEIYPKVREHFKKNLLKSNIQSREDIVSHYGRSHSEQLDKINNYKEKRNAEFNFKSEEDGRGIEWRSPNLLKIQTWKEFFEFWDIVYNSLEYFYKIAQKYEKEDDIKLEADEIKKNNKESVIYFEAKKRKITYSNFNINPNKFKNLENENLGV